MRTHVKIFFLMAVISLVAGCSKTDEFFEDTQVELKKAKMKVMPSTAIDVLVKAEEDWHNINDALQSAGSGDVVQLGEGLFYLHKSIIRWDFNGTFRGSGMGNTIIRTAPGMIFDISGCPPVNWSFEDNGGAFMLCFAHDYFENERTVSVSDLSIIVDEPTPVRPKQDKEINSIHAIMVMNVDLDNERDKPVNLNVSYKNLSITGEKDPKYLYDGYSLFSGLSAYGNSNGTFEVKNVSVENASGCIKPHGFMGEDARVIVKNSHLSSCVFGIYSFFDHSWIIQNNRIENSKSAVVLLGRGPSPQLLWEGPDGNSFIVNNSIRFGQLGLGVQNVSNVQVKDNVFEGSGQFGIGSVNGENWIIKDNNLCGVVLGKPFYCTIFLSNLKNSEIKNNANQVIGGPGATDPSIIIGEGRECN
ncbi:MAG: right-handed parallel beta-helix repeat-containing protein [Bacteroidales bacterium]|nr:right-handed parallel beta-helix repeat-containing protein [Bacteroidales bacterium]